MERSEGEQLPEVTTWGSDPAAGRWRLEDRAFVQCSTPGFDIGTAVERTANVRPLGERPLVRNVVFDRLDVSRRTFRCTGAVLDEVTIDRCASELHLDFCALRHVTIKGRTGVVWMNWTVPFGWNGLPTIRAQNDAFHAEVDWMLDISETKSPTFAIGRLPADKVRIDPLRQAFVTAQSLAPGRALIAEQPKTLVRFILEKCLGPGRYDDHELEAPAFIWAGNKPKERDAEAALIQRLHAEGLTVPTAPFPADGDRDASEPRPAPARVTAPVVEDAEEETFGPGPTIQADFITAPSLDAAVARVADQSYLTDCWPATYGSFDPALDVEVIVQVLTGGLEDGVDPRSDVFDEAVVIELPDAIVRALLAADEQQLDAFARAFVEAGVDMGGPVHAVLTDLAAWLRPRALAGHHLYAVVMP